MNNKYVFGAVLVALSVLASVLVIHPVSTVVQTATDNKVGSVTGPDSFFPTETHNGITTALASVKMNTGSTTVCSFKSPNATSTLVFASARLSTGSTTATMFEWGKGFANNTATTTSLGQWQLPASARVTMNASTSASLFAGGQTVASDLPNIISPNTFVNLNYGNSLCGGASCNAFVGTCSAKFEY